MPGKFVVHTIQLISMLVARTLEKVYTLLPHVISSINHADHQCDEYLEFKVSSKNNT